MEKTIKVLAVDDEKFNLLLLKSCLRGENYEVKTFENPTDALEKFKHSSFDVVLLDIMMRGIDGFGVRKLIRDLNREVPIIFLTSMVDDINSSLLNKIASDQYSYYMNKSFTKSALTAKIQEVCAIYNANREADTLYHSIEENLELAGEVQRVMLPPWCAIMEDMIVSYLYSPGQQVSGDMIELATSNGKHLVVIGDIAGHGVQAALYMSAMQSFLKLQALRNSQSDTDMPPHELLNSLDSFFRNDLGARNYMTCIVAIFDFKRNHLSFQNAGHPAIILAKNDGTAKVLESDERGGLPIALGPRRAYRAEDTVELDFEDNDMFVFYTDGILDLCNSDGETAGEGTFEQLLGALVTESDAVAIPFRLRRALEQIGFDHADDDISIAIVKKRNYNANHIYSVIHADTASVSASVASFGDFIEKHFGSESLGVKTQLLLSEFLNNTAVHGFDNGRHLQNDVFVNVEVTNNVPDEFSVRILDRGREWNYANEGGQAAEDILERQNAQYATSGCGMAIIHSITSRINRSH